ncbi:transcriptional regulator [Streptomyces sp. NPDC006879]|uniref:transcriptional regulator n=1 Tax=Streptomyces sp. NPDC006879 TaxID=3364767 RepID=UPI00368921CA
MQPNTLLDALLAEAGISHAGLAVRVNQAGRAQGLALRYEHTSVARWLRGQRPRGQVPNLICEVLSDRLHRVLTLDDIGFGRPGCPPDPAGHPLNGFLDRATALWRSDGQGRTHLAGAPALTGTPAVMPVWEWENPPEDLDVSRTGAQAISPATLETLKEARSHYELMYRRVGGPATRPRIVRFLAVETAPLLRGDYPDGLGRRLHRASGALVAVAGICAYDSDAHGLAQRYFHQALRLAKASGDRALGAYVIALLVNQALCLDECRQAMAFAEAALRGAGRSVSPALAGDLHAMQAKAYARLKDGTGARECIRRAEAAAARVRPEAEPVETGYVQPGLVDVQVAEALLELGDLTAAREHAEAAAVAPAHERGRVHRLAVLCETRLRQGDADLAGESAMEMAGCARGMESRRLQERLRSVRGQLLDTGCRKARETAGRIDEVLRVPW